MDIKQMLEESGIENITEGEFLHDVEPPYVVYLTSRYNITSADGLVINTNPMIAVELYHTHKDKESEKKLESVFKKHKINYSKDVIWLNGDQQLYEKIYIFIEKESY